MTPVEVKAFFNHHLEISPIGSMEFGSMMLFPFSSISAISATCWFGFFPKSPPHQSLNLPFPARFMSLGIEPDKPGVFFVFLGRFSLHKGLHGKVMRKAFGC